MRRGELAQRVDGLAERRETFVAEVRNLAAGLDARERELLGEILLERAREDGVFAEAFDRRMRARGWLRRQWDRAGGGETHEGAAR